MFGLFAHFVLNLIKYMLKEVDKPLLTSRKAKAGWLGQLFPLTDKEDALHNVRNVRGVLLFIDYYLDLAYYFNRVF